MTVHGSSIKIFSGNASDKLAKDIASHMGLSVGRATVGSFADGETSVNIEETVRGSEVFLIQSTSKPVNDCLMELLIMIDAVRRASAGRVTAVIPYYGYARQDRKVRPRDPITAKLVSDLITTAGADRVLTMDLHVTQIQGFFNIPVDHLQGVPVLAAHYLQRRFEGNDLVIVSPDLGSVGRARALANRLNAPIAIIDKRRPKANMAEVMNVIGDINGKRALIVDDMIDTAGTLTLGAQALIDMGAREVYACATHAVFSEPALERIAKSCIRELVITDTIAQSGDLPRNIRVVSVAPVFAEAIMRIYGDKPISSLYE